MARQDKISLQSISFNPTPFQAVTFTPQEANVGILSNALSTIEQREKETSEKLGAMDTTFSQIRSKLHQDPETLKWFENYTRDQKAKVKNYVDNFDFATAINKAVETAGEVVNNPELNARINANTTYENQLNVVKKMRDDNRISSDIYDWWVDTHPYNFEPTEFDDRGNPIAGTSFAAEADTPYAAVDYGALAAAAQKLIEPKKISKGRSSIVSRNNTSNVPGTTTTSTTTGGGRTTTTEDISLEDIRNNIDYLIQATSGGIGQIEQDYNVREHTYNKKQREIDALEVRKKNGQLSTEEVKRLEKLKQQQAERGRALYENGSRLSYEEYYARMIHNNMIAKGLVKHNVSTQTELRSEISTHTSAPTERYGTRWSKDRIPGSVWDADVQMYKLENVRLGTDADIAKLQAAGEIVVEMNSD